MNHVLILYRSVISHQSEQLLSYQVVTNPPRWFLSSLFGSTAHINVLYNPLIKTCGFY